MKRLAKFVFIGIALATAAVVIARLLFGLPDISARPYSQAMPASANTRLGGAVREENAAYPGKSGVFGLLSGHDALASRLALIKAAEHSIDAQYYI